MVDQKKQNLSDLKETFSQKWDSLANEKTRFDLAYSSAGAEYGESARQRPFDQNPIEEFSLDVDTVLDRLDATSDQLEPVSVGKDPRC